MSGTSLDGIDGVLVRFTERRIEILHHAEIAYPNSLQRDLLALFTPSDNEIERMQIAAFQRNGLAVALIDSLCSGIDRTQVVAIADHGQTVRHFPNTHPAYTLQLQQGARLAAITGIDTIVDFRSKDLAAGGQGAPLVPAFHQAYFADSEQHRCIVNIGGLANISLLGPDGDASSIGFDTGPGNTLLDTWCQRNTGKAYDLDGKWSAEGKINEKLLLHFLHDDYFSLLPPKSTGREYFNPDWLQHKLEQGDFGKLSAVDIQASLTALTAYSIAHGITQVLNQADIEPVAQLDGVYVCGGGAYNISLMQQLGERLGFSLQSIENLGVGPKQVESAAFAWLAKQFIEQRPTDLKQTTGAHRNTIAGALYRAN